MEFFLFELDDYALPSFASGTSLYFGTKSDFKNLLNKNQRVDKDLKATFKAFCAGNRTVKYYVAYSEKRFAYPVKLLCRKKIKLGAYVYEHFNIWGFPYAEAIGATMAAITTFLGALLGVSSIQYNKRLEAQSEE